MGFNHNKKRNVGLLREFISKHIAFNIVKNNQDNITKAKDIWKRYTSTSTELHKELKVITSLCEAKFDNKQVAYDYMQRLKKYCQQNINDKKLDQEKTNLIREIHNKISDEHFFTREVANYVDLASIQMLVSNWTLKESISSIDPTLQKLEDKVLDFVCNKQVNKNASINENKEKLIKLFEKSEEQPVDKLVIKIMNDKFNDKFTKQLSEDQKHILRNFVFNKDLEVLKIKLENLRDEALELIDKETKKSGIVKTDKERLFEIKNLLLNEYYDLENIDDSNILFYMSVSTLNEELKEER